MSNVIEFPNNRVSVKDILKRLQESHDAGEIDYLLIVSMGPNTNVKTAMTTTPAHCAVYMNQMQRLSIEELIRDKGMIP